MAVTQKSMPHPREVVFAALTTPETYPQWLLGCQDIRAVDEGWPAPDTRFHHRVGLIGPLTVADSTKVMEVDDPGLLVLEVRARPLGRGLVTFTLRATSDGGTLVTIDEVPLGLLAPLRPLMDPVTARRNETSLADLADFLDADRALAENKP